MEDLSKRIHLIIYRFREKGLEVFLLDPTDENAWTLPTQPGTEHPPTPLLMEADKLIELDPVERENGSVEKGWAVEADWHEIPSLKSMLYEDALQIMEKIREMEKGSFFAFKEALKKVLPHQYAFLKELKEILSDRNSTKNI